MADLHYSVRASGADGPVEIRGTADWSGICRITAELSAVKLDEVTACLALRLPRQARIFLNGYQSWTWSPEYPPRGRMRGLHGMPAPLIRRFGLDRYGDLSFTPYPNRAGHLHGYSWCYVREGERYRLFASLDERPGYTRFVYDDDAGTLTLQRDCAGVCVSGCFHAFDLFYAEGSENEVFDAWFAAMDLVRRPAEPIKGYTSWYNRYQNISQQTIAADLAGCTTLLAPGDLFQIDDGWECAVGDWLTADAGAFPDGMRAAADTIHAAGFSAGLWLAPFACQQGSEIYRQHPDWLICSGGAPWLCGSNWGGFYALDIDKPEVVDYLRSVFARVLDEWGFDLVKLDFLYAAAPFCTEAESRAARMTRAMDLLRTLCGAHKILACGVPLFPAFGRVEYCRIGCDVGLDWDDRPPMRLTHPERVSTAHSLCNTVFRRQLNGRAFLNDPDVFFLRRKNLRLSEQQKQTLGAVNALLGGVLLISDDPVEYDDVQRAQYGRFCNMRHAQEVHVRSAQETAISYVLDEQEFEVYLRKSGR